RAATSCASRAAARTTIAACPTTCVRPTKFACRGSCSWATGALRLDRRKFVQQIDAGALVGDDAALALEAAGLAAHRAIAAHHAVTGNHQRDRIERVAPPHGAYRSRRTYRARDLGVGGGGTHGNAPQCGPNLALEASAARVDCDPLERVELA